MIIFDILTLFPSMFDSYLKESMMRRAQEKKLISVRVHDVRMFSSDPHKKVDDRSYGGGPGMVLAIEPLARAIDSLLKLTPKIARSKIVILLLSASGIPFTQKLARIWSKNYKRIIMIAGRYEGVDERIKKVVCDRGVKFQEVSIGPYVLTGGELPAMVVVDAVSRHIPGVLGKEESLEERRHGVGVPVYTRPELFLWKGKQYRVPKILLGGNHKKIDEWRKIHKKAQKSSG